MPAAGSSEVVRVALESSPWCCCRCRIACGLTNSATIQAQIQGFGLTHPNIYHIYDLLEHMKELVLQI